MKCYRCTYCCTLKVKLSLLEYLRIILKGKRNFSEKNLKGERVIKRKNNDCFFLDRKNKRCKIYNIRPKMCREYPGI